MLLFWKILNGFFADPVGRWNIEDSTGLNLVATTLPLNLSPAE